jgi:hypothetical protein
MTGGGLPEGGVVVALDAGVAVGEQALMATNNPTSASLFTPAETPR